MKKKIIIGIIVLLVLVAIGVSLFFIFRDDKEDEEVMTDAQKFSSEYTEVSDNNVFVYRNASEIVRILENGTGVVYLGFSECKWCQQYVTYLNEAAQEDRSNNTDEYQEIVAILDEYLAYDEEGNKRVFVPAVVVIDGGEIVGFDDETSLDTHNLDDPLEYWTDEEVKDLMDKLATMFDYVNDGTCSECNE